VIAASDTGKLLGCAYPTVLLHIDARAMGTAAGRYEVATVTTLMICSAVCALTTLAVLLDAACSAAHSKLGRGSGIAVNGHINVVTTVGCFVHEPDVESAEGRRVDSLYAAVSAVHRVQLRHRDLVLRGYDARPAPKNATTVRRPRSVRRTSAWSPSGSIDERDDHSAACSGAAAPIDR
jgi:hypothetical protein